MTDARGRTITLEIAAGQAHDGRSAGEVSRPFGPGQSALANCACNGNRLRVRLADIGAQAVINPTLHRTAPPPLDLDTYQRRKQVGQIFAVLKQYRATATRCETHDAAAHVPTGRDTHLVPSQQGGV
ncbi:MAG: hypothetical protein AAGG09_22945 [Pseudomonadota bacterium]